MVGVEGGHRDTINTPQKMKRLLNSINSNNIQVVFDPLNLVPQPDYNKQDEMMHEAFDLFSNRIVAIHAKEFIMENGKKKVIDEIGKGLLNYNLLFKMVNEKNPYINISMESTKVETIDESKRYLKNCFHSFD